MAILVGAALVYSTTLDSERFGTYHDDGIYVTTAKALATGQGYRIISLPSEPAQTKYPPLYSFLLSLIWRANPHFPQNLTFMFWVSIAATLGFLAMAYRYLTTQAYASALEASIVVSLAAFNVWTIVFATSLISEMLYALVSVTALYLAEKYEKETKGWLAGAGLGVVLGLAVLTRTSGIALVLAVASYYLFRKLWKRALLPVAIASLFVLGWNLWCQFNRTTLEGVNVAFYTNYFKDVGEIIGSLQTLNNATQSEVWLTIAGKNVLGLILVSIPLVCSGLNNIWTPGSQGVAVMISLFFVLVIFMLIAANVVRRLSAGLRLLYFYLFFYLALHLPTPYTTYDRYLVPLLPFLLLFLVTELSRLLSTARKELKERRGLWEGLSSGFVGFAVLATVGVICFGYLTGIRQRMTPSAKLSGQATENEQIARWIMSNTNPSDVLISYRDPIYYLHTGRKATRSVPTTIIDGALFQERQPTVAEELDLMRSIIRENNGRYMVIAQDDLDHLPAMYRDYFTELIQQNPGMFVPVFESNSGRGVIYRIENSGG